MSIGQSLYIANNVFLFRSLECTLKCLNDAAGPCANTGFYQIVDMQMYKTYFRYACSNPEGKQCIE